MSWSTASTGLPLSADRIDVWRANLNASTTELKQYYNLLSADEHKRAERFHFDQDRHRYIIRRSILRSLIASYLETDPVTIEFSYNEYGKPSIGNNMAEPIQFNLSLSNDLALFAFSQQQDIGIDIEKNDIRVVNEKIVQRYFSESESKTLLALPQHQQIFAFYNAWTRKEAWVKARGMGLSIPLDSFTVSLSPDEPAKLIAVASDSTSANDWSMVALTPAPDYTAALAVRGPCNQLQLFDWQRPTQ